MRKQLRHLGIMGGALLWITAPAALAQPATTAGPGAIPQPGPPASNPPPQGPQQGNDPFARVPIACRNEVPRLCPELPPTASARDQVICLKYFKIDLPLGCRGAVNAAIGH